jgi:hypothetical protein
VSFEGGSIECGEGGGDCGCCWVQFEINGRRIRPKRRSGTDGHFEARRRNVRRQFAKERFDDARLQMGNPVFGGEGEEKADQNDELNRTIDLENEKRNDDDDVQLNEIKNELQISVCLRRVLEEERERERERFNGNN